MPTPLSGVLRLHVMPLMRARHFRKVDTCWERDHDGLALTVCLDQQRNDAGAVLFTLTPSVGFCDTEPFSRLKVRLGLPLVQSAVQFIAPPTRVWWAVRDDKVSLVDHTLPPATLEAFIAEQILPYLEQFDSTTRALEYLDGITASGHDTGSLRAAVEAVNAWRIAGSPRVPISVSKTNDGIRVDISNISSVVGYSGDLGRACLEHGTPFPFAPLVQAIETEGVGQYHVVGEGLEPRALEEAYVAYLSVVRFARAIPHIGHPLPWLGPASPLRKRVQPEPPLEFHPLDEGMILVRFRDDIAHELSAAVDECVKLARRIPWVVTSERIDREVVRIETERHDIKEEKILRRKMISAVGRRMRAGAV